MWSTSTRFRQTVVGSHLAVVRARLLSTLQFGANPTGLDLPLLAGQVTLSSRSDIKASGSITVPGDYWDLVEPFGGEVFIERGVAFGDGTSELVPLGYFRIDKATQDQRPFGPVVLDLSDRTAQLQQTRAILPWQVPAATTHRQVVAALINGVESGIGTYGMYGPAAPDIPVTWTNAGYNPDTTTVGADLVVDDSAYDFLAKLVDAKGATLRFAPTGELTVIAAEPAVDAPALIAIIEGVTGTLIKASRSVSRDGVVNIVRATGSDPAHMTGYQLAFIPPPSKLAWNGPIGPSIRYYASPLLTTADQAAQAAGTILGRSTGLPTEQSLFAVPDPATQPLDKINTLVAGVQETHIVDQVSIPLIVSDGSPVTIRTRTTNPADIVDVSTPSVPSVPDPEDPSGGGTTDPGSGGGGPAGPPDPLDGTQIATLNNWGPVIDGDEFNYNGRPPASKWGLYDGAGHDGNGRRVSSAWTAHDGILTCHGDGNGNTGGAAFHRGSMGYRIEVRARVYNTANDGGDRYHPVLILWPDSDQWPQGAEYDYFECDEGDPPADVGAFMHLPNHQPYRQDHFTIGVDITQWHNYACEWDPRRQTLKQWTDGVQKYNGSGRVAQAPGPMHPTIQLDNFGGDPRSANFDIAWVRIYAVP